jgi:hypothetical protein
MDLNEALVQLAKANAQSKTAQVEHVTGPPIALRESSFIFKNF